MRPAVTSKREKGDTRLMVIDHRDEIHHTRVEQLPDFLEPGDLIVVNTSGTLPSSFLGQLARTAAALELRLAAYQGPSPGPAGRLDLSHWLAVAFGEGSWRVPTESRGEPPTLRAGDRIVMGEDLAARVLEVDPSANRLVQVRFESESLERALYRHGVPIQYSHLTEPLQPWDQQTLFSGPPISVEPPSASFPFTWGQVLGLRRSGINFAPILHGAGISTTGDEALDRRLPFAEYFEVPAPSADQINEARAQGRRVVALGTTVARALESAVDGGALRERSGLTPLKISSGLQLQVVDALLSGMHEPGTSHFDLQAAFCNSRIVRRGFAEASTRRYRAHEYGDLSLLACTRE